MTLLSYFIFFFNDTATTEIYTLSLHDALPISPSSPPSSRCSSSRRSRWLSTSVRSEEHTSELQSLTNLVCRLLLEKKIIRLMSDRAIGFMYGWSNKKSIHMHLIYANPYRLLKF